MNFIKKTILGIVKWAATDNAANSTANTIAYSDTSPKLKNHFDGVDGNGLTFTVFSAVGGKVVQTMQYNPATDRRKTMLYVITDKDDIGQEIGQIITVESLSR